MTEKTNQNNDNKIIIIIIIIINNTFKARLIALFNGESKHE